MPDEFAIATAATEPYLQKLRWCLPTWTYKPQFQGRRLYIFYHGFNASKLSWVDEFFPSFELIEWTMPEYDGERELMLSSFVLGAAQHITEPYYCKLDADAYFYNDDDVWDKDDFSYDLVAHRWGYTKPKWWVEKMQRWVKHEEYNGTKGGSYGHKRIISWCCLHNMEFVRRCATAAGTRLPIPSHDSYMWFMADHFDDCSWHSKNVKARGVDHQSRWRSIRESICGRNPWNAYLNRVLLSHVQLDITTACNLSCDNCDRNCGTAPSSERMSVEQIRKFIDESIGHEWKRIDIIGGEPTLHPDLAEILQEVKRYKDVHPKCKIRLTSNGVGAHVQRVLAEIPDWIEVRNSDKEKGQRKFEAVNVAPRDERVKHALACSIPWRCGLGLSKYGYFLCGAGASVARVHGLNVGIRQLSDLTIDALQAQQKILCSYCGHSRSIAKVVDGQQTSKTWKYAFKHYKRNSERLELY